MDHLRPIVYRLLWILGFIPLYFLCWWLLLLVLALIQTLLSFDWVGTDPSGKPTFFFGIGTAWFFFGAFPFAWGAVAYLVMTGRLYGTSRNSNALHLCTKCGYDLRGSANSQDQPCPECGAYAPYYQRKKLSRDRP